MAATVIVDMHGVQCMLYNIIYNIINYITIDTTTIHTQLLENTMYEFVTALDRYKYTIILLHVCKA